MQDAGSMSTSNNAGRMLWQAVESGLLENEIPSQFLINVLGNWSEPHCQGVNQSVGS